MLVVMTGCRLEMWIARSSRQAEEEVKAVAQGEVAGTLFIIRTVEQIQSDIRQLPPDEVCKIRDFLDDLVEDELEFTDEFEGQIRQSEAEMKR